MVGYGTVGKESDLSKSSGTNWAIGGKYLGENELGR